MIASQRAAQFSGVFPLIAYLLSRQKAEICPSDKSLLFP